MTLQVHRAALGQAGEGVVREAVRQLEAATRSTEQGQREMARLIGGARTGAEQQRVLLWVAGLVFAGTFVLSPLLAGCLPFGSAERYAAWVVARGDRWDAGMALMLSASPEGWRRVADASQLVRANAKG